MLSVALSKLISEHTIEAWLVANLESKGSPGALTPFVNTVPGAAGVRVLSSDAWCEGMFCGCDTAVPHIDVLLAVVYDVSAPG